MYTQTETGLVYTDTIYIYGIVDSRTPSVIGYVGCAFSIESRFKKHMQLARGNKSAYPVYKWMRSILADGGMPEAIELHKTTIDRIGEELNHERQWIKKMWDEGHPLTNVQGLTAADRARPRS